MRRYFKAEICLLTILVVSFPIPSVAYSSKDITDDFLRIINNNSSSASYDDDDNHYNNDDNYSNNDDDDYSNNNDDNYSNNDDNNDNDDDDNNDNDIPLDGGLSFLAIAGAGLGIKKMRDHRSKKKQDTNNHP